MYFQKTQFDKKEYVKLRMVFDYVLDGCWFDKFGNNWDI